MKKEKDNYLKCSRCGKRVSSVPFISDAIVMAWVECPECLEQMKKVECTDKKEE